jgi:putative transposase
MSVQHMLQLFPGYCVPRRQAKPPGWRPGDRLVFAAVSRRLPRHEWHRFPVRPETLPRWHRDLVYRKWAVFGRRRGPGRPPLAKDLLGLVLRLARVGRGVQPRRASLSGLVTA